MEKPQKETYGWESPTPQDEGGWCIEGGEEAYYDALHEYYRLKAEKGEPLIDREKFEQAFSKDAELARNLKERKFGPRVEGIYEYKFEFLSAVSQECHLGPTDVEQVLNAIIRVCEKPQP